MNDTLDGSDRLRSGAMAENRIILQVRYLLLGSSQKRISLTQLPS